MSFCFAMSGRNILNIIYKISILNERNTKEISKHDINIFTQVCFEGLSRICDEALTDKKSGCG